MGYFTYNTTNIFPSFKKKSKYFIYFLVIFINIIASDDTYHQKDLARDLSPITVLSDEKIWDSFQEMYTFRAFFNAIIIKLIYLLCIQLA